MNRLRHIIRSLTPFGIVARHKRNRFMQDYERWKASHSPIVWEEQSKFRQIVSVQGFGYSGSGAVVDLLREYDNCRTLGYVSPIGSLTPTSEDVGEINFVRLTGGLLHLGEAFGCKIRNYFWQDHLIKEYINQIYFSPLYQRNPHLRPYFYQLLDEIVSVRIKDIEGRPFNETHERFYEHSEIYLLKDISYEHYLSICRKMLYSILNTLHRQGQDTLVLDQFLSDCGYDTTLLHTLLPELRQIVVWRDPRDLYSIATRLNVQWMAHDNVSDFIEWMRVSYHGFDPHATTYLPVEFERLVSSYDTEVSRIEHYLSLDHTHHTKPRHSFDPEVSRRGVAEWRHSPMPQSHFEAIQRAMPQLCYDSQKDT